MYTVKEQAVPVYNVSGFTETTSVPTDFDTSATYSDYREINVTVLLSSTTSSGVVIRGNGHSGGGAGSRTLITGVAISCVTCILVLLIVIPLVIWRCRAFKQHDVSYPDDGLEANKRGE